MSTNITGTKRKSRFASDDTPTNNDNTSNDSELPPAKRSSAFVDLSAAAAKAAEISRELAAKLAGGSGINTANTTSSSGAPINLAAAVTQAAILRAQLAAQEKKLSVLTQIRPLLLDAQGREIDEHGRLITTSQVQLPAKTVAINNNVAADAAAVALPVKKKENPYLAHRQQPTVTVTATLPPSDATTVLPPLTGAPTADITATTTQVADATIHNNEDMMILDDRLAVNTRKRELRAKKALQFVDPGRFIAEEEAWKLKEERKMISGYASGRKQLNKKKNNAVHDDENSDSEDSEDDGELDLLKEIPPSIPDWSDNLATATNNLEELCPTMEWWDELYLPKAHREKRRIVQRLLLGNKKVPSSANNKATNKNIVVDDQTEQTTEEKEDDDGKGETTTGDEDEYELLQIHHCKTHKYVQHPPPTKPLLTAPTSNNIVPTYLTKAERKKLRKATRAERERTKREQQMLGLVAAPEPKFKLSNFMKILGDTAVSDPSKVEKKVVEQIQKRMLNHVMRNLATKLTPQERKQKQLQHLQQDASRALYMAVFRVTDFTCTKYQYKIDVHAQQWLLSGVVLLCHIPAPVDKEKESEKEKEVPSDGGTLTLKDNSSFTLPAEQYNLVVVEGGAKGMRKFMKLMTTRIHWQEFIPAKQQTLVKQGMMDLDTQEGGTEEAKVGKEVVDGIMQYPPGYLEALRAKEQQDSAGNGQEKMDSEENDDVNNSAEQKNNQDDENLKEEEDEEEESDSEDEDDDDDEHDDDHSDNHNPHNPSSTAATNNSMMQSSSGFYNPAYAGLAGPIEHRPHAKCEVLWQGMVAKRQFTGFKFEPASSLSQAKKFCEGKQIVSYWDMLMQAEAKDGFLHTKKQHKRDGSSNNYNSSEVAGGDGATAAVGDIFDADFWN